MFLAQTVSEIESILAFGEWLLHYLSPILYYNLKMAGAIEH